MAVLLASAVDSDPLARGIGTPIRHDMTNRIGDILGLADSTKGHLFFDLSQVVHPGGGLHESPPHFGFHQPRRDHVDPNAEAALLGGKRESQGLHGGFAHVVGPPTSGVVFRRHAGDHHDVTALLFAHAGKQKLAELMGAQGMNAHQLVEFGGIRLEHAAPLARDPGIVHQDAHGSEFALVFWILTAWLSRTLQALQADLSAARERQTRIDRLRAVGALAAGLSHEFATPLNTAQLRLGRLARSMDLTENPDLITAREELNRCGEVLRHMAGSQLDPERLSLEAADLDALVAQVCRGIANDQGVSIRYRATGRAPYRALIPSVAFSQGLINLIDNALQSGGEDSVVDVWVEGGVDHVDLSVADRGPGWPEIVRNHLGEPFVTTKPGGVGLGLYYVHSLSEAIGASLLLEDRPQGGAVARISLPRAGRVESALGEA